MPYALLFSKNKQTIIEEVTINNLFHLALLLLSLSTKPFFHYKKVVCLNF